jgi:hypothetical protein
MHMVKQLNCQQGRTEPRPDVQRFSTSTVIICLLDLITEKDNSTSKLRHLQNILAAYRQQSSIGLTTYRRVNAEWDDEDKEAYEQFEKDLSLLSSQGGTETTEEPTRVSANSIFLTKPSPRAWLATKSHQRSGSISISCWTVTVILGGTSSGLSRTFRR